MELSPDEKAALDDFCRRLRARFAARVQQLALFGSRARGDVHEESDIDVSVVIDDLTWQEKHEVWGIAGDILTERSILLSAFVVSSQQMEHLRSRERLIAREIGEDGIPL